MYIYIYICAFFEDKYWRGGLASIILFFGLGQRGQAAVPIHHSGSRVPSAFTPVRIVTRLMLIFLPLRLAVSSVILTKVLLLSILQKKAVSSKFII